MEEVTYNVKKQIKFFSWGYVLIFGIFYAIVPLFFADKSLEKASFTMASITLISIIGYLIGLNFNFIKNINRPKFQLSFKSFSKKVFIAYIIVIGIIYMTAGKIPLIESLRGASQEDLFGFREAFLKKREGWEAYLSYIITLIDSAVFPYIIIHAFNVRNKHRFLFLITFIIYSLSFLEKAYFFKIALPLFCFFFYKSQNKKTFIIKGVSILLLMISGMFAVSRFDSSEVSRDDPFFSILYTPHDISTAIAWRAIAVPVVTALEGMDLFVKYYKEEYFFGGTSSFLSFLFGFERINFERLLYQSQFGGQETGNANQCYLLEAYINFGHIGIVLFSFFVGRMIKGIIQTRNIAALCIMPLFLYNLFNTGLIGNLLSNGFILFFLLFRFFRFNKE